MFIKNAREKLYQDKNKFFSCGTDIAVYLMTLNKIPLLFRIDEKYYFSITNNLKEALEELPSELEAINGW